MKSNHPTDIRTLSLSAVFNIALDLGFFGLLQHVIVSRSTVGIVAVPLIYGLCKAAGNYFIPYLLDRSQLPVLAAFIQSVTAFLIFVPIYIAWTYAYHPYLWLIPFTVATAWATVLVFTYQQTRKYFYQTHVRVR